MKRATCGRGLFYNRDSGGKHETTPPRYVTWAGRRANDLGVTFDGTPEVIERMIQSGEFHQGDIFLDYDVKGNLLSRPALDAMREEALRDQCVSHIFIPRRDRLARPNNPIDGAQLELGFRQLGITIIYQDAIATACHRGKRLDLGDLLACIIQFEEAGKDRRELAEKIIQSQITLALAGYSTGGRAPYGFRRWLVRDDGTKIRELEGGERVRMRGHHVVWLPVVDDHPEMITICRILQMLSTMPATQVARTLTSAGIPTPDHGRTRKDNGIRHLTSGVSLPNDYEYCPEQAPLGLHSLWAAFHGRPAAIYL